MSDLISVDEAWALIDANLPKRTIETVSLYNAYGHQLAEDLTAKRTQPPLPISAMDGYAVRLADVNEPGATLSIIGESPAGTPFSGIVNSGQTVRIFTGGVIPNGADHIVIQEDTDRDGQTIMCREGYSKSRHIRVAGIDFKEGDSIAVTGARVTSALLSLAAASNHHELKVFKPLRIGILANGNELKPPGSDLAVGEIINSNPAGLSALIRDWGAVPVDLGIAKDSPSSIAEHIPTPNDVDIIVTVGGASVGDHDHMRTTFANAGFEKIFEKIAVRPGKPTWFSRRGEQLCLGLPGNPASAIVCAYLFLRPLIVGELIVERLRAKTKAPLAENSKRTHFMRAQAIVDSNNGELWVDLFRSQDSSLIRPFLTSNAFIIRRPLASACSPGSLVDIMQIGELFSEPGI